MTDLFHYPDDRPEIFGEADGEEAAFYFMLHDFEYWVKKDGADFVLNRLDPMVLKKLADFFDS